MTEIEQDIQAYARGLRSELAWDCIRIEKKYDLYGLPPQLVSECLNAILKGESVEDLMDSWGS